MIVPVVDCPLRAAPHLHEPRATLDQPPGHQTALAEVGRLLLLQAIGGDRRRGLSREVERGRRRELHPGGELARGDPGFEVRVEGAGGGMAAIEPADRSERVAIGIAPGEWEGL